MFESKVRRKKNGAKRVIGWREKVDLPEMELFGLDAKVDTGAYTSSIHCHNIWVVKRGRREEIHFNLLDPSHPNYQKQDFRFKSFSKKRVKNSFGVSEPRFVIITTICMGGEEHPIFLTLSDRSSMRFPLLLGRKFISETKYLVNASKAHLLSRRKKKRG